MPAHHFVLVAGALCLDFVNTVGDREATWRYVRNYLNSYEDLVSWGVQTQMLNDREAAALRTIAKRRPDDAAAALERAVNLRETLHTVFSPIAAKRPIPRDALASLNALLPPLLMHSRIERTPDASIYHWAFAPHADDHTRDREREQEREPELETARFDRIAWSVVQSATALLTSSDIEHVHQCALETCGWLFLDLSKNKTRRWCAMKLCGNKAKVRHHRATMRREA